MAAQAGLGEQRSEQAAASTPSRTGELCRCPDPAALRVDPPFRVISGILGEDLTRSPVDAVTTPSGGSRCTETFATVE